MNILDQYSLSTSTNKDKIAIICDQEEISFIELQARVLHVKNLILQNHCDAKYVGILLDTSIDFIVAFMAVLQSKKVIVLLDFNWSNSQLEKIITSYPINLIITDHKNFQLHKPVLSTFASNLNEDLSFYYLTSTIPSINFEYYSQNSEHTPMFMGFTSGTTNLP